MQFRRWSLSFASWWFCSYTGSPSTWFWDHWFPLYSSPGCLPPCCSGTSSTPLALPLFVSADSQFNHSGCCLTHISHCLSSPGISTIRWITPLSPHLPQSSTFQISFHISRFLARFAMCLVRTIKCFSWEVVSCVFRECVVRLVSGWWCCRPWHC